MRIGVTNRLDDVRTSFNGRKCKSERSPIGQFLTPAAIAQFMGCLFEKEVEEARILGSRCRGRGSARGGYGVANFEKVKPKKIEVVAYENDSQIIPYLKDTMVRCELACKAVDVSFSWIYFG